jgi:uncharacterized membrane protein
MPSATKLWLKRLLVWLAVAAVVVLLSRIIADVIGFGLGLTLLLLELLGWAIFLVGMPFFFWVIGEAVYRVFIKPYVRAWRINRIRHVRQLREAVERGQSGG